MLRPPETIKAFTYRRANIQEAIFYFKPVKTWKTQRPGLPSHPSDRCYVLKTFLQAFKWSKTTKSVFFHYTLIQSFGRNQQGGEKQSKDHAFADALFYHEPTAHLLFAVQHTAIDNIFFLKDGCILVEIQEVQTDALSAKNANKKTTVCFVVILLLATRWLYFSLHFL